MTLRYVTKFFWVFEKPTGDWRFVVKDDEGAVVKRFRTYRKAQQWVTR